MNTIKQGTRPVSPTAGRLRQFLARAVGGVLVSLAVGGTPALADYPDRPLTLVVPSPPGGSTDAMARLLGNALGERLGQTVVVENRAGGGGIVAATYVLGRPADGYTLMLAISSKTVANALQPGLPFDAVNDLMTLALLSRVPTVVVVPTASGLRDFEGFRGHLLAEPGKVAWGVPGIGTAPHLTKQVLTEGLGAKVNEIQYRGSAPMHVDLLAGRLGVVIDSYTALKPYIDDGRVVPVAVVGQQRIGALPAVPTLAEQGQKMFAEVLFDGWNAVDVRAGTPAPIVERLSAALREVLNDPSFQAQATQFGLVPFPAMSVAEAQAFVDNAARTLRPIAAASATTP